MIAPLIELPGAGRESYSDGPVEDALLDAFLQGESASQILARERSWPALYHLSAVRRNLLEWLPLEPNARVLEIGAGCGALTGLLCERTRRVTAVELSRKRAEIIRARHGTHANLTIAVGNVRDLPAGSRYDVATLIGVLEYAPAFTSGPDPAAALLELVAARLAPGGTLLIAIENRFGLKYWAGAAEDHTGAPFDGLEGYPQHDRVRTYSRTALEALLRRAGFSFTQFFYPMPDYKLPESIYSDARPLEPGELAQVFPTFDRARLQLFDERAVLDGIAADGAFPYFANSFLVLARESGAVSCGIALEDVHFVRYSQNRLARYQIETRIVKRSGRCFVRKRALDPAGAGHVAQIVANHQDLQGLTGPLRFPTASLAGAEAELPFVAGTSLESVLIDALLRRDGDGARAAAALFGTLVRALAAPGEGAAYGSDVPGLVLSCGIMDINLDNLLRDPAGQWWLIDVEWRHPGPVSADFVIARGLEYVVFKRQALVAGVLDAQALFEAAGIPETRRAALRTFEQGFQRFVRGEPYTAAVDVAFQKPVRELKSIEDERDALAAEVARIKGAQP